MQYLQRSPVCPVCGSSQVKAVHRTSLSPEYADDLSVLAYRCHNGHTFLPANGKAAVAADAT